MNRQAEQQANKYETVEMGGIAEGADGGGEMLRATNDGVRPFVVRNEHKRSDPVICFAGLLFLKALGFRLVAALQSDRNQRQATEGEAVGRGLGNRGRGE